MSNDKYLELALKEDPELRRVLEEIKEGPDAQARRVKAGNLRQAQLVLMMQLLTLRRAAHLTQAELAEKVGMPQSSLARIESGKANPTLKTLLKISEALNAELNLHPRS